jgi:hypothetical protein
MGMKGLHPLAVATAAACAAMLLVSPGVAVQRAVESVNSGGLASASASYRAHDSIGQHAIGPVGTGATLRIYDGFWLGLPGINVPVEGAVLASLEEDGAAIVRWTVGSLGGVVGFNVCRATVEHGEYATLNEEPLAVESPGAYRDATVWPGTTFWYEVRAVHADGSEEAVAGSPASVTTPGVLVLALYPPRPNPGAGLRTIQFDVPDHVGPVRLAIYNVRGQRVRTLVDGPVERGRRESVWDGTDDAGAGVATGVYFVRLELEGRALTEKLLTIR